MKRVDLALSAIAVALAAACSHPPQTVATPAPAAPPSVRDAHADSLAAAAAARSRAEAESLAARRRADSLAVLAAAGERDRRTIETLIHFDFDRATIKPAYADLLDQKVPVLRASPSLRLQVVGNCDERGSDEYNLALGNRRAIAAKTYLVDHGIDAGRINTASNGKERPIDPGHNEAAWAMNRNDQFVIQAGNVALQPVR